MESFTEMADRWIRKNASTLSVAKATEDISHGPTAWSEDFHRWALDRCVYRDRCFGTIGSLHGDFAKWIVAHDGDPCTRRTFELLLTEGGFLCADGLVSGLVLRVDLGGVLPS